MKEKLAKTLAGFTTKQRDTAAFLLALVLITAIIMLWPPQRSVASYCKLYKDENEQLTKSKGADVFSNSTRNAHDFAVAYSKLERVAPSDIDPDVKTLKLIFEKIDKDPSQALAASLSGLSAESSVKKWTAQHCGQAE
jgi:hypothetical protein